MKIKDFELIENVDKLFSSTIIILGLGYRGKQIFNLLRENKIHVKYVYDRTLEYMYEGSVNISLDDLKDITLKEECFVIIGSDRYKAELIDELIKRNICVDTYTWYGVQVAIEWNINNAKISKSFRDDFYVRKEIFCHNFETTYWLRQFTLLTKSYNPILIYQPGKVGSSTLSQTLNNLKVENIHIHNLMINRGKEKRLSEDIIQATDRQMDYFIKQLRSRPIKIITLVREPIGRELSQFMQAFSEEFVRHEIDKPLLEYANEYISKNLLSNSEFEWFNRELKTFTGIDIYSYPFNREDGYIVIKENNFEVLVLKMEMLSQNEEVIGKFIGKRDLKLINSNVGTAKHYQYIYQEIERQFTISKEIINKMYEESVYFSHFYTMEEKQKFIEKWRNNII